MRIVPLAELRSDLNRFFTHDCHLSTEKLLVRSDDVIGFNISLFERIISLPSWVQKPRIFFQRTEKRLAHSSVHFIILCREGGQRWCYCMRQTSMWDAEVACVVSLLMYSSLKFQQFHTLVSAIKLEMCWNSWILFQFLIVLTGDRNVFVLLHGRIDPAGENLGFYTVCNGDNGDRRR
jgi:hypothetical protein